MDNSYWCGFIHTVTDCILITDKEVKGFWNRFDLIIISWNVVSLIGFVFLPIALLLKYVFKVKGIWLLNDSKDGDFGDPVVLEKYGYTDKPKWFRFLWWWFRNHSWNYIEKFKPTCNSSKSQVSEYRIFHDSRGTGNTEWLQENGLFYICYRCKETNKVYCRYSKVTDKIIKQMGAGGDRYKLHLKPR